MVLPVRVLTKLSFRQYMLPHLIVSYGFAGWSRFARAWVRAVGGAYICTVARKNTLAGISQGGHLGKRWDVLVAISCGVG